MRTAAAMPAARLPGSRNRVRPAMAYLLQLLLNGLQVSVLYGLLAVSYVLIHAITRRINFAFGSLAILGGYGAINISTWLALFVPGELVFGLVAACVLAVAHTALFGLAIDRMVSRPLLRASSLAVLVATLGVALTIEEILRLANDSRERWLLPLGGTPITLGSAGGFSIEVTPVRIIVAVLGAVIALAIVAFIKWHPFGRIWRATSQDLVMAEFCGVDVGRAVTITMVLASAIAGSAGAMLAVTYGVASYYGGFVIGLKTLFIAVVGGLGSIEGALIGGLILGLFETLWSGYGPLAYRDAAAFAVLTLLLILFPNGILAALSDDRMV